MSVYNSKNFAKSTIASGIASGATSLTVAVGEGSLFPTAPFLCLLGTTEIVLVTVKSGDVFTLVRGYESSGAVGHAVGTTIQNVFTAGHANTISQDVAGISAASTTGAVTTTHLRQVNASTRCTAAGEGSQVNASIDSTTENLRSQINASDTCTTTNISGQVNAAEECTLSGSYSQINASDNCTIPTTTSFSQINASAFSEASGLLSQVNASYFSEASGLLSQVCAARATENASQYSIAGGYDASSTASTANRKWHIYSDTGNVQIAGTLTSSFTFTDYGEYFPNLTGIEIPVGTPVVVDGYGVRPVRPGDDIDGVVSATAALRLGDTPFAWQGRYLRDEWGRTLMHDILISDMVGSPKTVSAPVENPDYDPAIVNIPRSERPTEWTLVGMVGQVFARVHPDALVGDYLEAGDGVAKTALGKTNVKLMKITQSGIGYCLIR
jgi:hypothetical protein